MTLSEESANRVALLYEIAKGNGSLMTLEELSRLMAEASTEGELEEALASHPSLSTRFELKGGYVMERLDTLSPGGPEAEENSRKAASHNLEHAFEILPLLKASRFKMVAVTGSTSYGSASLSRDLDFFCITQNGQMWGSLSLALLMSRVYSLVHRGVPKVCLSYVMDLDFARFVFSAERDPLFARDALQTRVLSGRAVYQSLIRTASWISRYYPAAYEAIVNSPSKPISFPLRGSLSLVLNRFLYVTVGGYIRIRSFLLNRKFSATGRVRDVFDVRIGENHLIYESRRYATLRQKYGLVRRVVQNQGNRREGTAPSPSPEIST